MTEKHPLPWRQKSTPKRGSRRSRNWQKLYLGHHFPNTTWTLTQGPWKAIRRTGTLSHVTVLCDPEFGGCGKEHDRLLNTIIRGDSTGCKDCWAKRRRLRNVQRRELAEAGTVTKQVSK